MKETRRQSVGINDISSTRFALEEAWDNWLKEALVIAGLGVLGLLYYFELVPERILTGLMASLLILIPARLTFVQAGVVSRHAASLRGAKVVGTLVSVMGAMLIAGGLIPGSEIFHTTLNHGQSDVTLGIPESARDLQVLVEALPTKTGESEFKLDLQGETSSNPIEGTLLLHELKHTGRGRGSTGTVSVDLYARRYIVSMSEAPQKLHVGSIDAGIPHLKVTLLQSWLPLRPLFALGIGLLLLSLYFDGRLSSPRNQTYFTILSSFLLVTGAFFYQSATPSSLIRNLIGSTMMGGLVGVMGGMLLSGIVRNYIKQAED